MFAGGDDKDWGRRVLRVSFNGPSTRAKRAAGFDDGTDDDDDNDGVCDGEVKTLPSDVEADDWLLLSIV